MSGYDFNRPYIEHAAMARAQARDDATADEYGRVVLAADLTNMEYKLRFQRLNASHPMKSPPSAGRIFPGYLVVRHLGQQNQYETWMPDDVFEELYELGGA